MGSNGTTSYIPLRLDGKVALVAGAGRGIGAAMAVELGRCGSKVITNYVKSSGPANKVVEEIKSLGSDAVAIQADVSQVPQIVRLFDEAVQVFGGLDIVCSNSGVVSFGHLSEVTKRNSAVSSTSTLVDNSLSPAKLTSTLTRKAASS